MAEYNNPFQFHLVQRKSGDKIENRELRLVVDGRDGKEIILCYRGKTVGEWKAIIKELMEIDIRIEIAYGLVRINNESVDLDRENKSVIQNAASLYCEKLANVLRDFNVESSKYTVEVDDSYQIVFYLFEMKDVDIEHFATGCVITANNDSVEKTAYCKGFVVDGLNRRSFEVGDSIDYDVVLNAVDDVPAIETKYSGSKFDSQFWKKVINILKEHREKILDFYNVPEEVIIKY